MPRWLCLSWPGSGPGEEQDTVREALRSVGPGGLGLGAGSRLSGSVGGAGGRCRRRHTAWHILPERSLSDCGVSAPPGGGGNACVSTSHPISFLRQREVLGADASTVRSTQRCPHIFGPRFADWPHGAPCPSGLTTGTQRCSCTGRALHNGARSRGRLHGRCRFVCFPAGFREMAATCLVLTETDW